MIRVRAWREGDDDVLRLVHREARHAIDLTASLTGPAGISAKVRLLDISASGVSGVSSRPLPIGATIVIDLPILGAAQAQVRWALGPRFGAAFWKDSRPTQSQLLQLSEL